MLVSSLLVSRAARCRRTEVASCPGACPTISALRGSHGDKSRPLHTLLQGFCAPDHFGNLLRDLSLAGAVVLPGDGLDHVAGVLGGRLHGHAAGDLLADRGVEE